MKDPLGQDRIRIRGVGPVNVSWGEHRRSHSNFSASQRFKAGLLPTWLVLRTKLSP